MALQKLTQWAQSLLSPDKTVRRRFLLFQQLLHEDKTCLKLITRLEEIGRRPILVDWSRVVLLTQALESRIHRLTACLQQMRPQGYSELGPATQALFTRLHAQLPAKLWQPRPPFVLPLDQAWEHPRIIGGKAWGLARIVHQTTLPVQPGFVITINAFHRFQEANNLRDLIRKKMLALDMRYPLRLQRIAVQIQQAIMNAPVPEDVRLGIDAALETLRTAHSGQDPTFAVRSSAVGEDGEASFAGQYTTQLNVPAAELLTAYKSVLAGKYSAQALTYRLHYGLSDAQTCMAALVLPMVQAQSAGVMYSRDPLDLCKGACLVISAVPGLGTSLVDGSAVPDIFLVSRQDPSVFLAKQPASSSEQTLTQGPQNSLCLDDSTATQLATWGLELEQLAQIPQDVEWALDGTGALVLLQSRPIHQSNATDAKDATDLDPVAHALETPSPTEHVSSMIEVGTPASVGIACGPVFRIDTDSDLDAIPEGVIVLSSGIPPTLVRLVHKVRAVIAEQGSKASHFASVAREFKLPVIVGLGNMSETLKNGRIITIDAHRGVLYDGVVQDLLDWEQTQRSRAPVPFQHKMAPLLNLISSLHLTDPTSADFSPRGCRSLHDIVRFVHEKGTQEMFSLMGDSGRGVRQAKPLETEIPIVMHVLDLGGGLRSSAQNSKTVVLRDVLSQPMLAVWQGLADKDVSWSEGLLHVDWDRFDQISGGIFSLKSSLLSSYALVAPHYAHLLLRFGYHFAVLDTMAGDREDENYIQFRFKGGGGDDVKKIWRLIMIQDVLKAYGFQVTISEDLLEAKCMRLDRAATELRLNILGYLLGRTPLLDMALESREHAQRMAGEMLRKWRSREVAQ
jgi:pyruvate, water dikinase